MIQKGSIEMKKYLSLLLVLCLTLSLTACGGAKEEPAKPAKKPAARKKAAPKKKAE